MKEEISGKEAIRRIQREIRIIEQLAKEAMKRRDESDDDIDRHYNAGLVVAYKTATIGLLNMLETS